MADIRLIWVFGKSEYFSERDWTTAKSTAAISDRYAAQREGLRVLIPVRPHAAIAAISSEINTL
jgi:hypothetical protein